MQKDNVLTQEKLTRERNIFLIFFIMAFVLTTFFNHLRMQSILEIDENFRASDFHGYSVILPFLKLVIIYFVYRLSRIVKLTAVKTLLYCILAPLSYFQIIPFILLLAKVKSVRTRIGVSSESIKSDENVSGR